MGIGSQYVDLLGGYPLPIEVIPMARSHVARQLVKLGGDPVYREGVVTDNGNIILDLHNLRIDVPREMEQRINNITGVVCTLSGRKPKKPWSVPNYPASCEALRCHQKL